MMNQIPYTVQFFLFNPEVTPLVQALTISCLAFFLSKVGLLSVHQGVPAGAAGSCLMPVSRVSPGR